MSTVFNDDYKDASRLRLNESNMLYNTGTRPYSFEGSFYLGGYVVEMSLKFIDETVNGRPEKKKGSHTLDDLKKVLKRIKQNDILENLCKEILNVIDNNSLIAKWNVNYRYQGSLNFLTSEDMSKFNRDIKEIYTKSREIEREWKQLQRGSEDGR